MSEDPSSLQYSPVIREDSTEDRAVRGSSTSTREGPCTICPKHHMITHTTAAAAHMKIPTDKQTSRQADKQTNRQTKLPPLRWTGSACNLKEGAVSCRAGGGTVAPAPPLWTRSMPLSLHSSSCLPCEAENKETHQMAAHMPTTKRGPTTIITFIA